MRSILIRCWVAAIVLIGCADTSRCVAQTFTFSTLPSRAQLPPRVQMTRDAFGGAHAVRRVDSQWPRLPAEFETPHALLLSISDWHPQHRPILQEIAVKTSGYCPLVILCADSIAIQETTAWLAELNRDLPDVYFCPIATDTVWMRDFGPIFLQTRTSSKILDFFYLGERPIDDHLPTDWARQTNVPALPIAWTIQGGNLMANGNGLALTTNRIFDDNHIEFQNPFLGQDAEHDRRHIVVEAIADACNLEQLVVLEPLQNEETQHVDMFTTFIAADTVLVANVLSSTDPVNAGILNRNVERLRNVRTGGKPLKIHRLNIPTRDGNAWSAYTNAILTHNLVLVPVLETDPPHLVQQALHTYQQLLPDHRVETINMTSMRDLQGELHCLSMHVPIFAPMPKNLYGFDASRKFYFPDGVPTAN
ncbi:agmatine/peptidylarginine deiminase [Rhodopirellula rubra]|uniref:Agmatine/peptidylarginine deiminase n=1 Tax=Aporhodopirellula rubra TaxID=980271 RepID=A0A7W5E177_9BACT|nr:agmatine deiminase family protein [Aporhodopirellula rubra]MBB3207942.1 agmatine/peptidylarginine deiminase [Aporhodopirellula rubra]